MKKVCFILFGIFLVQTGFSQKEIRQRVTSKWETGRRKFVSGDTLVFTLTVSRLDKNAYYTDAAWYKLYRMENGKKIPLEDTSKKGSGVAVDLGKKDHVVVKKIITQPGIYFLRYPVFPPTDDGPKRVYAEQKFTINMRDGISEAGGRDRFDQ